MSKKNGSLNIILIFLILILVVLIGFIFFLLGKGNFSFENLTSKQVAPSPLVTASPIPVKVDDEKLIKEAVYQKTGLTADDLDVTVSKIQGNYATGGLKEKEAVGGAYFIAAKTDSGWVIVYDGQSQPPCKQLDLYDFPVSLAPQCVTTSGTVVDR